MNKTFLIISTVFIGVPLLIIWSLNQLGLRIDYSFGSWLAIVILLTLYSFAFKRSA